MDKPDLALGIDASTQSMTAVALSLHDFSNSGGARIRYRDDPRLSRFGLSGPMPVLPPREPGEADQPAGLFLAALDLLFSDLGAGILSRVAAVNFSAQQHGQILVAAEGLRAMRDLGKAGAGAGAVAGAGAQPSRDLLALLGPGLASDRAPIWMSSQTQAEAREIREAFGGAEGVTAASGSDSPLRFSGAVLRHIAKRYPETYARTARAHLISSFLAGLMAADPDAPIDWGNGSGMSLMNWRSRAWDPALVEAVSSGLAGGSAGLLAKLPPLSHPLAAFGEVAAYFRERYGFPESCVIIAGSGDNPQSKVLAQGALLSLGTSFVLMTEGRKPHVSANAMYDGLGRPFMFGCRSNGALALETLRVRAGLAPDDFAAAEAALAAVPPGGFPGSPVRIFQGENESFPASGMIDAGATEDFARDYSGAVDSSLGLMVLGAKPFAGDVLSMAVTGGVAASPGILARVAAFWGVPVTPIAEAGAAAGAAVAALVALAPESRREERAEAARSVAARPGAVVLPDASLAASLRAPGGYLERLKLAFKAETGVEL